MVPSHRIRYCDRDIMAATISSLLRNRADVNTVDKYGYTTLHEAALYGNVECMTQLLNCPNINVNARTKKRDTPIQLAGSIHVAILLLARDDVDLHRSLFSSRHDYRPEIAMTLIAHGADYTSWLQHSARNAAEKKRVATGVELRRWLLDEKYKRRTCCDTRLQQASPNMPSPIRLLVIGYGESTVSEMLADLPTTLKMIAENADLKSFVKMCQK
jgi:hypothetical protein